MANPNSQKKAGTKRRAPNKSVPTQNVDIESDDSQDLLEPESENDDPANIENDNGGENRNNRNRQTKIWVSDQVIATTEDMTAFFTENQFWKRQADRKLAHSIKTYYYCNINGTSINKCPAQLCVLKKEDKTEFNLLRSENHNHEANEMDKKVTADVRDKIKELFSKGLTQRLISHDLRTNDNIRRAPSENQVRIH